MGGESKMKGEEICQKLDEFKDAGTNIEDLLQKAVELLHNSNSKFHWTGIYELFPDNVLRLGPFIGAPTDHVFISVGKGVCGSAVADKCNKNIPDVSSESNYLACSSATKSELVILIRKGDKIFAQIDIDSHEHNAFSADAVSSAEMVAEWLANLYEQRSKS